MIAKSRTVVSLYACLICSIAISKATPPPVAVSSNLVSTAPPCLRFASPPPVAVSYNLDSTAPPCLRFASPPPVARQGFQRAMMVGFRGRIGKLRWTAGWLRFGRDG
ncbi:hypothetical protein ACFE04_019501 [Oxalis oulophora]